MTIIILLCESLSILLVHFQRLPSYLTIWVGEVCCPFKQYIFSNSITLRYLKIALEWGNWKVIPYPSHKSWLTKFLPSESIASSDLRTSLVRTDWKTFLVFLEYGQEDTEKAFCVTIKQSDSVLIVEQDIITLTRSEKGTWVHLLCMEMMLGQFQNCCPKFVCLVGWFLNVLVNY